ncbi:HEAT repeat domain-containing protein [Occallatibacter savannae]|uniref:HEAT repeat domain-containing protein n=1 Tax=Occallatibacter savannae TaxID=1002691 RepID=UPI000D69E7C6|nr:HEAT repeat domain-containing protein [Occallatibacter savannae]
MRRIWLFAAVFGFSALGVAQQPKVVNAQLHSETASAGLATAVDQLKHSQETQWLGYSVPAVPGSHFSTWWSEDSRKQDGCCGVYRLEAENDSYRSSDGDHGTETSITVLARFEKGAIDKIRFVGTSCEIDAGGLPFTWLTGVNPDDSVAWLSSLVTADEKRHSDQALAAIAMHETQKATTVLDRFASSSNPLWLREKGAFWLGAGRGHEGYLALKKMMGDSDPEFRKKLSFDLFVSKDPAAVDDLIGMAKSDKDVGVREQAIFWVGQKAGHKAVAMLKDTVENDPEVGVKKKAVFALSQLPKDEAVPELLHVAQTNASPTVRKEAIFWLGQTHDPRALDYFEQILSK